ncbi:Fur-regulated basic protein FbpA [Bacillus sonorensis]|uniref:Stress response protein n=2 Tax=Bacillus sonorensis TaxID=119858 RepID=M5PDC8_9BACI|nr:MULTISPECIES: Fur-regulated basic protein FbpA [Bacillus]TWK73064.1 Stress response protein YkoL [Bacillus paralicheniformis]ASB89932.1 Stress response protein YkoL [Bacillus sonorensis]EME74605.1 stress response protein [Bacillus sonorensis L12]MBG9916848.1 stress protein [Bacillus sonorensis]MCF7619182.1 Fur-regulated basic protein FbpA [Bacillus sonorensis]
MSKLLKNALEKERKHYSEKLMSIGVYNRDNLQRMTITELRNEYFYFFRKNKAPSQNKIF